MAEIAAASQFAKENPELVKEGVKATSTIAIGLIIFWIVVIILIFLALFFLFRRRKTIIDDF